MNGEALNRLLAAARRRLWCEAALQQLRIAMWCGAAMLLLAAITGLWLPTMTRDASLLLAGLVFAAALSPALSARPDRRQCALRIDRHFGGHALITTALEFGGDQAGSERPAISVLRSRAAAAAGAWRPRLGELWQRPAPTGFVLALLPVALAFLLMEVSASAPPAQATSEDSPSAGTDAADPALMMPADAGIAELRRAMAVARESARSADEAGAGAAPASSETATMQDEIDPTAAELTAVGSTGAGGGTDAGDADPSASATRLGDRRDPRLASGFEALTRRGATQAATAGDARGYADFGQAPTHAGLLLRPAAAPAGHAGRTLLNDAQVAYARRYLDSRDE